MQQQMNTSRQRRLQHATVLPFGGRTRRLSRCPLTADRRPPTQVKQLAHNGPIMCSLRPTSDLFSTPERRRVERTTDIRRRSLGDPCPREYSAAPATFARSAATAAGEIYSLSSPEKRARIKVYASFGLTFKSVVVVIKRTLVRLRRPSLN